MKLALNASVESSLAGHGIRVTEPAPNTWLMKGVPCHAPLFSKAKTNLLIIAGQDHCSCAAFVDEDLVPQPRNAALAAMFTTDVKNGWRRLHILPVPSDCSTLLKRVLSECLRSPAAEQMPSQQSIRDARQPSPAGGSDLGASFRMAARRLDTAALPEEVTSLYEDTIARVVSVWRRSTGGQVPVLWGVHPRRQTPVLYAAAKEIAGDNNSDCVFDVCCPILAAGCSTQAQLDAVLNQFLVEARDAGGLLLLRELDVLLSASRTAAAILLAAIGTWGLRMLGGVGDSAILSRLSTNHPDVRAMLVPIRVKHPPMITVTRVVADLFAHAGIEDTGGMAQRVIARFYREDPLSAFDVASTLVSELRRRGEHTVFPDDVGASAGAFWMEVDAMTEDEAKKGDWYGTDPET